MLQKVYFFTAVLNIAVFYPAYAMDQNNAQKRKNSTPLEDDTKRPIKLRRLNNLVEENSARSLVYVPKSKKRKSYISEENNEAQPIILKRIKSVSRPLIHDDYAKELAVYEIDSSIPNETILQKALDDAEPRKKNYSDALFYRVYKGNLSLHELSIKDLKDIVFGIKIYKEMSDIDIFAWSVLNFQYLLVHDEIYEKLTKNAQKAEFLNDKSVANQLRKAGKKLVKVLANKTDNKYNFYNLCAGMNRLYTIKEEFHHSGIRLEGMNKITIAYENKNGFAAFILGELRKLGSDWKLKRKDYKFHEKTSPVVLLKKASHNGYLFANYELGKLALGNGSFSKAFKYFKNGAELNQADCKKIYLDPGFVKLMALRKDSKKGSAQAQKNMAFVLLTQASALSTLGNSPIVELLKFHPEKAKKMLEASAKDGDIEANLYLAQLIKNQIKISKKENRMAEKFVKNAADSGSAEACKIVARSAFERLDFDLALQMYKLYQTLPEDPNDPDMGIFSDKDFIVMIELYQSPQDNIALQKLGRMLLQHDKTDPIKLSHAIKFLQKSLELDCPESAFYLGEIYKMPGPFQHLIMAKKMYFIASDIMPQAHSKLGEIAFLEGDLVDAIKHYVLAAKQMDFAASMMLQDRGFQILQSYLASDDPNFRDNALANILSHESERINLLDPSGTSLLIKGIANNLPKAIEIWERLLLILPQFEDTQDLEIDICKKLLGTFARTKGFLNPDKARRAAEKLDELGVDYDSFRLALAYEKTDPSLGILIPHPEKASYYLHKAASQNNVNALLKLAKCYVAGCDSINIGPDKFQALRFSTLSLKLVGVAGLDQEQRNLCDQIFKDVFIRRPGTINKNAVLAQDQREVLDALALGEESAIMKLKKSMEILLSFSKLFNENSIFGASAYTTESFHEIMRLITDIIETINIFNENIDKPGFFVGVIIPKDAATREALVENIDYFPVNKTPYLFLTEALKAKMDKIYQIPSLLKALRHKNAYALNLLMKYQDKDDATIRSIIDFLSLDTSNIPKNEYINATFGSLISMKNNIHSKTEQWELSKKALEEINEYCSDANIEFLENILKSLNNINTGTWVYRNKLFIDANEYLGIS